MYTKKIKSIAVICILVISFLAISGCNQNNDTGDETTGYHKDAGEYLISEGEIEEDWVKNKTREPNFEARDEESSRVINFDRNGDNLTIVVIVLESISDAKNLTEDQKDTVKSLTNISEHDLGDEAFSVSIFGETQLNIRLSNVFIQVYGNIHLNNIKGYGQQQIDKIKG